MKTQINTLVKGDHREKISGTSKETRAEVARKVGEENPEKLTIEINGETVELTANWSLSRKSVCYCGYISIDTYRHFVGDFGLTKKAKAAGMASITIHTNMTVTLSANAKKPMWHYIDEKNITIK